SKVTMMSGMFMQAHAFDQSLGDWSLKSIERGYHGTIYMIEPSEFSTCSYEATLRGWAQNPDTPDGVEFNLTTSGLTYSDKTFRDALIAKDWTIEGDIYVEGVDCVPPDTPTDLAVSTDGTTLTGKAEPNSTVEAKNQAGESLGTAAADQDGNFSIALSEAQTSGQELSVTATDEAGNVSEPAKIAAPVIREVDAGEGEGVKVVSAQKIDEGDQVHKADKASADQLADTGLNLFVLISGTLGLAGAGAGGVTRLRR